MSDYVEIVGTLGSIGSGIVQLKDGSLLSTDGRTSRDNGRTWSTPRSLVEGVTADALFRAQTGELILVSRVGYGPGKLWLSMDDGAAWSVCGTIAIPGGPVYELGDTMVQLHSGRLLYCWDYNMSGLNHPGRDYQTMLAHGRWRGKRYNVEGHTHVPEFYASGFSWSDDLGKSWEHGKAQGMPDILMGWFDFDGEPNGMCGITPCGEACLAETNDDRVLYFARSTVGRIVYSYSSDDGKTWEALRPTDLAASNSPPRLRRIPSTGDLLCVWNQVSGEEIRRGFRRGRLSSAISRDNGATWENFKTIELSEGLERVARVTPDKEARMVRARQELGDLPDGFAFYHYANVRFAGDNVYLMYSRGWPQMGVAEQALQTQEQVLRIYPLKWFYS